MKTDLTFLRPLIISALQDERREWTAQGFGFLRTYFGPADAPKRFRLNLWDSSFSVPNVSTIHDHPWHFTSVIVAGQFCNVRYDIDRSISDKFKRGDPLPRQATHSFTTIRTGEGGGMEKSPIMPTVLIARRPELYAPGEIYYQAASEIHETLFKDGSITFNERTPLADGDHARVFWPFGTNWVDAIPRPAARDEVANAVSRSLRGWF